MKAGLLLLGTNSFHSHHPCRALCCTVWLSNLPSLDAGMEKTTIPSGGQSSELDGSIKVFVGHFAQKSCSHLWHQLLSSGRVQELKWTGLSVYFQKRQGCLRWHQHFPCQAWQLVVLAVCAREVKKERALPELWSLAWLPPRAVEKVCYWPCQARLG